MNQVTEKLEKVTVLFAGDSGDGIQLTGTQFTNPCWRTDCSRRSFGGRQKPHSQSLPGAHFHSAWSGQRLCSGSSWCGYTTGVRRTSDGDPTGLSEANPGPDDRTLAPRSDGRLGPHAKHSAASP